MEKRRRNSGFGIRFMSAGVHAANQVQAESAESLEQNLADAQTLSIGYLDPRNH